MSLLSLTLLLVAPFLNAQAPTVPPLTSPVVDQASLFSADDRLALERRVMDFNQQHKVQLAILIANDLGSSTIEEYSMRVVESWQLGKAETDRGLLLLIAPNQRKMRIEVGQGLEGLITDVQSKRLIVNVLGPAFQRGAFVEGIVAALTKLGEMVQGEPFTEDTPEPGFLNIALTVFFVTLFLMFGLLFSNGSRSGLRRGGYGGGFGGYGGGGFGGSSGGGFSGGGGGFSGGGSSGDW